MESSSWLEVVRASSLYLSVVPVHLPILRDLPKGRALLEAAVSHPAVPRREADVPVSGVRLHLDLLEEQCQEPHGLAPRLSRKSFVLR